MQTSESSTEHSATAEVVVQSQVHAVADRTNLLGESLAYRSRLYSIDMLRGLVMVIMALDHVRFFFTDAYAFEPTDLTQTNAGLFLTRWITHFCAPVFIFLAGTGAFLSISRGKTEKDLTIFLLSRGLWLVLLDLFAVHTVGWWFNFDYHLLYGDVLWATGWSMVVLAGLVRLPHWSIVVIGATLVTLHNLVDSVQAEDLGSLNWLWAILHSGDMLEPLPGVHFIPGYPLVPWIGVMALGYGFGALMQRSAVERQRMLWILGAGLTLSFIVLRASNVYGDPNAWSAQKTGLFTLLSFVNCEKYPPSLLYLLMTLGPAIVALAAFEGVPKKLGGFLVTLGRVPLFYYLLHLTAIHALAVVFSYFKYGQVGWMFQNSSVPIKTLFNFPSGYGYGLMTVYAIWIGIVVALYPACRWFADVKARRREAWLSYL